jgi:predicted RNA-binding Zn ribbon-like protein
MMEAAAQHSDWRDGFVFVGNHLILDFLNTCPVQDGQSQELLPDFNAVLRWFRAAGILTSQKIRELEHWEASPRAQRLTAEIRQLREKLRRDIATWEHGGKVPATTINELNELMARHPMLTSIKTDGKAAIAELWFEARQPEDLFAPIAHSAAILFAAAERKRVRQCGNCVLHFYDISKKGTRHWCSMRLCGNRLKVAAYAARQRRGAKT